MTGNVRLDARRRMSRLLISDEIQRRISRLNVNKGDFSADLLSGVSLSADNARLNESEVFALFELCARMNIRIAGNACGARLDEMNGHPAVTLDFASLCALNKRLLTKEGTA